MSELTKDFARDQNSKALVSGDIKALERHKRQKAQAKLLTDAIGRINKLEQTVVELQQLVAELQKNR